MGVRIHKKYVSASGGGGGRGRSFPGAPLQIHFQFLFFFFFLDLGYLKLQFLNQGQDFTIFFSGCFNLHW